MEEENNSGQISCDTSTSTLRLKLCRESPTDFQNVLYEVCGNGAVDHSIVICWASCFHSGLVRIQDDSQNRRPTTATGDIQINIVTTLMDEGNHKTCEEIAYEAKMSTS